MSKAAEQIPVWCDDRDLVAPTIDAMVATGAILPAERSRCVFWQDLNKPAGPLHEQALEQLN